MSCIVIRNVKIHPTQIVIYNSYEYDSPKKSYCPPACDEEGLPVKVSRIINSSRKAEGKVSQIAKRKIGKAVDYLLLMAREKKVHEKVSGKIVTFRSAFITLTLPSKQLHPDSVIINKLLNQFIIEIKKNYQVKNYIWRAEKQKNGNLHFHILIDKFIPYYELRNRWNRITNKLGYVDRYAEKNNKNNPNSTDIHSTRKVKNLKAYISKYMMKEPKEEEKPTDSEGKVINQEGRIWGCNQELSKVEGCHLYVDSEVENELKKIEKTGRYHVYHSDYFSVIDINLRSLERISKDVLFAYFASYLFKTFDFPIDMKLL